MVSHTITRAIEVDTHATSREYREEIQAVNDRPLDAARARRRARLADGVRRALASPARLSVGFLAAGLAVGSAHAAPFPAEIDLSTLLPANGGDGTTGFVISGEWLSFVAGRGDVNGDGIDDLVLSARRSVLSSDGEAFVVFGSNGGFPALMDVSVLRPENGGDGSLGFVLEGAGHSLSMGDINGDGIADIAVGNPYAYVAGMYAAGRTYVLFGRSSGFPAAIDLTQLGASEGFVANGTAERYAFGQSVSLAGDVNGDGIDDLVVGSLYDAFRCYYGCPSGFGVAVVYGRLDDFPDEVSLDEGPVISGYGGPVSAAGDVNGDGVDDILIGSRYEENISGGGDQSGRNEAYLVLGHYGEFPLHTDLFALENSDGSLGTCFRNTTGCQEDQGNRLENMGYAVAIAGDVNGDGLDDILLGDGQFEYNGTYFTSSGKASLVFGHAPHLDPVIDAGALSAGDGTQGTSLSESWSVNGAGDVNGDGIDDFLVGFECVGSRCNSYYSDEHAGFLVFGSRAGFPASIQLDSLLAANGGDGSAGVALIAPTTFSNREGFRHVKGVGDVNGDGIEDIVLTNPDSSSPTTSTDAFIVFGRDGGTRVPNVAPYFTSVAVASARPGDEYRYRVTAVDPDHGDTLGFSADSLPAWLTLVDNGNGSALLSGLPAPADAGDQEITLHVADDAPAPHSATQSFTLSIAPNEAPVFTSAPPESGREGFAYRYEIHAQDPNTNDVLTITASQLPAWLTLTDEGGGSATLVGTPGAGEVGSHDVVLEVHDNAGLPLSGTQAFTVVVAANAAPEFTSIPPLVAREGVEYVYAITTRDPEGDGVQLSARGRPGWLVLTDFGDGTGELRGTPAAANAGEKAITIVAADDAPIGRSVEQPFELSILANQAPVFVSVPIREALVGEAYRYEVTVNDADPDDEVIIDASVLPSWLHLTDHGDRTALLSGTPTQDDLGDHVVTIDASHEEPVAKSTSQGFIVTVTQRSADDNGGGGATGPFAPLGLALTLLWRRRHRNARRPRS